MQVEPCTKTTRHETTPPVVGWRNDPAKLLHRDVYVCNWIETEGETKKTLRKELFPLKIPGGGRQSLSEDRLIFEPVALSVNSSFSVVVNGAGISVNCASHRTFSSLVKSPSMYRTRALTGLAV
jgi:hypothetical protein